MKALIPLLIVSTSALAVTTVQFAQRAGTERRRADAAQAVSQKNETRIRQLEQSRNDLEQQLMEAQRPPIPSADGSVARRAAPPPPLPGPSVALDVSGRAPIQVTSLARGPMFAIGPAGSALSPAAQRYMRWQAKNSVRRQYGDVASSLGLSQEQADKFLDLLADQQTNAFAPGRRPTTPADMKQLMQDVQEARKRNEAQIASLLGESRMAQWQDYQKTLGEHIQANMMAEQMQNMGVPITDDQRAQLYNVILEERQRNPVPNGVPSGDAASPEEQWKQSMKWQDERDRNLLERLKGVLTNEQYERYQDYQEWQREMRNNAFHNIRPAMPMAVPQNGNSVTLTPMVGIASFSSDQPAARDSR